MMLDPIAEFNKSQSDFYRKADAQGRNDRADVTTGSGVSQFDHEEENE